MSNLRAQGEKPFNGTFPLPDLVAYTDGRSEDVVVPVTEQIVEWKIPASGRVRRVEINRDHAAIGEFSRF